MIACVGRQQVKANNLQLIKMAGASLEPLLYLDGSTVFLYDGLRIASK